MDKSQHPRVSVCSASEIITDPRQRPFFLEKAWLGPAPSVSRSDGTLFSPYLFVFQYAWVEKHFGPDFLDHVVLAADKTVVSADLLIDDRPDITGKWPAAGEERAWS